MTGSLQYPLLLCIIFIYTILVPWLVLTATSKIFLLAIVTGTATGHNVVRFGVGGGDGHSTTSVRRQGGRKLRALRQQRKPPTVCREGVGTHAVVRGTGGGGGRRLNTEEIKIKQTSSLSMGSNIIRWGQRILTGQPTTTSNFQVLPAAQVGRRGISGARSPVWAESGADSHALAGIQSGCGRPVKVHCH